MAEEFYENLADYFKRQFESIKDDEELQVLFYDPAGQSYAVHSIGYVNPNLIILDCSKHGETEDNTYHIALHAQAVQLFILVSKKHDERIKPEFGFLGSMGSSK
jgi:hypothetical protein